MRSFGRWFFPTSPFTHLYWNSISPVSFPRQSSWSSPPGCLEGARPTARAAAPRCPARAPESLATRCTPCRFFDLLLDATACLFKHFFPSSIVWTNIFQSIFTPSLPLADGISPVLGEYVSPSWNRDNIVLSNRLSLSRCGIRRLTSAGIDLKFLIHVFWIVSLPSRRTLFAFPRGHLRPTASFPSSRPTASALRRISAPEALRAPVVDELFLRPPHRHPDFPHNVFLGFHLARPLAFRLIGRQNPNFLRISPPTPCIQDELVTSLAFLDYSSSAP